MAEKNRTWKTPEGRLSFPALFEPKKLNPNQPGEPKYSATILLPKDSPEVQKWIAEVKEEFVAIIAEKWPDPKKRPAPEALKKALKDGDTAKFDTGEMSGTLKREKYPEMAGHYILAANSTRRPSVIDRKGAAITNPDLVYPGCWVKILVQFFAYSNVNVGIGCSLGHVLFCRDDTPLGGSGMTAEEGFKGELTLSGSGADDLL